MDPAAVVWLQHYRALDDGQVLWCAGGWGDQPARWTQAMQLIRTEVGRWHAELEAEAEQARHVQAREAEQARAAEKGRR